MFLRKSRYWAGVVGPPVGGDVPANFFSMRAIEIYIDESGDFGPFDEHCPYYIVTMVFHESSDPLFEKIQDLEYRLSLLGLEDHCIHSSPAIRGEHEYHGMDLVVRRKMMSNFAGFIRRSGLKYKCFFIKKDADSTDDKLVKSLGEAFEPFLVENYMRLSSYSQIQVAYDKGQKLLSELITKTFLSRFQNVRLTKVLPIHSRLFQVADFICTLKRMSYKVNAIGGLSRSEEVFFGSISSFRKNWLKPFKALEWV